MKKEKKNPAEVIGEETKVEQVAPNAETIEATAAENKPEEEKPVVDTSEQVTAPEEKTETATAELNAEIPASEESVHPNAEQYADPTEGLVFERYFDIMSHSYKQRLVVKK